MGRGFVLTIWAVAFLAAAGMLAPNPRAEPIGVPRATTAQKQRAAWLWESRIWRTRATELLDRAQELRIDTLFIALDIEAGEVLSRGALRSFLRAAHARGMAVLAVEGDPHMVLANGRPNAIARARAIRAYQLGVVPEERLDGLQYDIEPYVLPKFDTSNPRDLRKWSDTFRELRHAFTQKIDIVLPFWIADEAAGADFVRTSAAFATGFTVMAYRTKADRIIAAATPILDLGVALDLPVRVALEMGPTQEGPGVSFEGDLSALLKAMRQTLPTFAEWPSFAGFAIHGITWPGQTANAKRR